MLFFESWWSTVLIQYPQAAHQVKMEPIENRRWDSITTSKGPIGSNIKSCPCLLDFSKGSGWIYGRLLLLGLTFNLSIDRLDLQVYIDSWNTSWSTRKHPCNKALSPPTSSCNCR